MFKMNGSINKTLLASYIEAITFWGEGCDFHILLAHNDRDGCSHSGNTSKFSVQILCLLDCLFAVPSAEHSLGPA